MKLITEFIIEKLKLNKSIHIVPSQDKELEDLVDNWFWNHCNLEDYDDPMSREDDLEAMKRKVNDPMVNQCISDIESDIKHDLTDDECKYVEIRLAELAEEELNK